MAETATKKSRIVSEDADLEASLMLEFNKRLKTCLSSEALNGTSSAAGGREMASADSSSDDEFVRIERECRRDSGALPQPSVKERMLLGAADPTPCLLFTQTVTSPLLTPSDERVDFLHAFDAAERSGSAPSPDLLRDVLPSAAVDCQLPRLQTLKAQYMRAHDDVTSGGGGGGDHVEMQQLRALDIARQQITKFEQISPTYRPAAESTLVSSETTTMTTTTTVIDGATSGGAPKKKSKKKARSQHEKENISVSERDVRGYNVSVKSLCRSFGDLTKLPADEEVDDRVDDGIRKSRTKSLTDMRSVGLLSVAAGRGRGALAPVAIENVFTGVSVKALTERFSCVHAQNAFSSRNPASGVRTFDHCQRQKSSFSKFDALQKKNVLHVRSADGSKAPEKFHNANSATEAATTCKSCAKTVFQMEQMKAERAIWHKNCFRCTECNKQLTVDTYQSHGGALYCKPHFKALFAPKVVEEEAPQKPRKHELIIRENQPEELPPDVVRASDKPDLGLAELHALNVKQRFQVFEPQQTEQVPMAAAAVSVKRSPSILSKLARFQAKGMDTGFGDESLNGVAVAAPSSGSSSSDEGRDAAGEDDDDDVDVDLVRARRAQREKPFHFAGMSDVKSKWEHGEPNGRDERREERKQEIQNIRNRLFMGKQGKMKELYQLAVLESESGAHVKRAEEAIEATDTRSIKARFERGDVERPPPADDDDDVDAELFESAISRRSRTIFQQLDANASKAPAPPKSAATKIGHRPPDGATTGDVVKSSTHQVDDVVVGVPTKDIQQRFRFFETYREPERERKRFRITPPRDGQVKVDSPDREVQVDLELVRPDSAVAVETQTAQKMLNKFRQMEEDLSRQPLAMGPKPLKRFTPPPEPLRSESEDDEDEEEDEDEAEESEEELRPPFTDGGLVEAQKAARAKQLRAKFEQWEANEMRQAGGINAVVSIADEQAQIESTKALRARFESLRSAASDAPKMAPRAKVNRFVSKEDVCQDCGKRVYPLEKIAVHGVVYHKVCFKCMECNAVLRMDSYAYNQGLLYCTPHFKRLFIAKGNYDTAFGLEQHKEKWNTTMA